jgi:hypothetical protein
MLEDPVSPGEGTDPLFIIILLILDRSTKNLDVAMIRDSSQPKGTESFFDLIPEEGETIIEVTRAYAYFEAPKESPYAGRALRPDFKLSQEYPCPLVHRRVDQRQLNPSSMLQLFPS